MGGVGQVVEKGLEGRGRVQRWVGDWGGEGTRVGGWGTLDNSTLNRFWGTGAINFFLIN